MLALPPWPYTRADAEVFVQRSSGLMIEFDGEVVGGMGIGDRHGRDCLGYWIGKRFWRRGFATEAAQALISRYFTNPARQTLYSAMLVENRASWHLQSKLGFEKVSEGRDFVVSRQAWLPNVQTQLTRTAFESNGL
ncbi:MAG: GNAT family N-acetyltransferase [Pseudomonadota bacterium]